MDGYEDDRFAGLPKQVVCQLGALLQGQVAVVAAGEDHALVRIAGTQQTVQRQAGLQHDLLLAEVDPAVPEVMGAAAAGILAAVSGIDQDGADLVHRGCVGTLQQQPQLLGARCRQQHGAGAAHDLADKQRPGAIHQHPGRTHPQRHVVVLGGQHSHLPDRVPLQHRPELLRQFQQVNLLLVRGPRRGHGSASGRQYAKKRHQTCRPPRSPHHAPGPAATRLSIIVIIVRLPVSPENRRPGACAEPGPRLCSRR